MQIQDEIIDFLKNNGVADIGFAKVTDGPFGDKTYAVSIVVRLSNAVLNEIKDEPTYSYFQHYRAVNAFIDRICLQIGFIFDRHGYEYIPVAASQSINKDGWNYNGRYSHKKAACLAGLGGIGKNGLFIHKKFGPRVRLGTVFTNCQLEVEKHEYFSPCISCDLCVKACPSGAIKGVLWHDGMDRSELFNPEKCSEYMKKKFQHIGRGSVCGLCIVSCPIGEKHGTEKN